MAGLLDPEELFTSNEELDAIFPGDATVDITGYVDVIEGSRLVGTPTKKPLYKCVLNNGHGRRIRILMWEENANKYERLIHSREILHIERGKALPVNLAYAKSGENVMQMEISVQRNTKITLLEKFGDSDTSDTVDKHQEVSISEIGQVDGAVIVTGYIKVPFVSTVAGNTSYGTGAITDGFFKLQVQITQFNEVLGLVGGAHVRLKGEIKKNKFDTRFLQVSDMEAIELLDEDVMSTEDLKSGFHPIPCKGGSNSVHTESPSKKDKYE